MVLFLLKSPFFSIEKFLTSSPQNKISFSQALFSAWIQNTIQKLWPKSQNQIFLPSKVPPSFAKQALAPFFVLFCVDTYNNVMLCGAARAVGNGRKKTFWEFLWQEWECTESIRKRKRRNLMTKQVYVVLWSTVLWDESHCKLAISKQAIIRHPGGFFKMQWPVVAWSLWYLVSFLLLRFRLQSAPRWFSVSPIAGGCQQEKGGENPWWRAGFPGIFWFCMPQWWK